MVVHRALVAEAPRRSVTVLAVGGTIAMKGDPGSGATPALDADALTAGLDVEARSLRQVPSVQLSLADALEVARAAAETAASGRGAVVTTGTDTLEELAVLTDVVNDADAPVVFTGAMRPASAAGADGPANVADAVAVAAQAPPGTYVVFAGEVHAAREARKVDSTSPRGFGSPRTGPIGFVAEGRLSLHASPPRPPHLAPARLDHRVPIVTTYLGDDGSLIPRDVDGLVLVALGAGHLPPVVLDALPRDVPVVATVRPERGALLRATYAFRGAEPDLHAAGVIAAGASSPQAARMRLLAALGAGLEGVGLRQALADLE